MIALLRMSPLMSGAVYLDDINIATVPLFKLRSAIAIIPQVKRQNKIYVDGCRSLFSIHCNV